MQSEFKRQLESYELLSRRKIHQDRLYKNKATSKISSNTSVDVCITIQDLDYIDPLGKLII